MDYSPLKLLSHAIPSPNDISAYAEEKVGDIFVSDNKTCNQPRESQQCPLDCNRHILHITSDKPLTIFHLDDWQETSGKERCDCLIYDSNGDSKKFAFCELTCSIKKYVDELEDSVSTKPGKRAKAYRQMSETWRVISESDNPVFSAFILQFHNKIGIFGWRDRTISSNNNGGMKSMQNFLRTPGSESGITEYPSYIFGEKFSFIQVKYPSVYDWRIDPS